jgi:hypothetical protein
VYISPNKGKYFINLHAEDNIMAEQINDGRKLQKFCK